MSPCGTPFSICGRGLAPQACTTQAALGLAFFMACQMARPVASRSTPFTLPPSWKGSML